MNTDGEPYVATTCWVLRESAANRDLVRRYPAVFRAEFTGSSRAWVESLEGGAGAPLEPGLVWADPARGFSALNLRRNGGPPAPSGRLPTTAFPSSRRTEPSAQGATPHHE
jgi:hypothetical protein